MTDEAQSGPVAQPDEQQRAQAERWKRRLQYFGKAQDSDSKRWKKNRLHVNGEVGDDGESGLVRVNLIASVVNTIQPNIYAKAPEVSVQPEDRLDPAEYKEIRGFARTLEMALNRYAVRGGKLKTRGKEAVRSSLTSTTGWVKVIFQRDKREDPLVRNRLNDTLDNVQNLERLLRETEDEGQCAQYEAKMAELKQQAEALRSRVEVTVSEGIVIDNVLPEHILILDKSVQTIDEYGQASAIAHGVFMTVAAYKAQFKKDPPKKATRYRLGESEDGAADAAAQKGLDPDDALVLVWEIWSKDDLTVYTQCDGAGEYCRDPYQPQALGEQWYPMFPLQLWRVHGYLYARTLVDNLIELVDEYNTRRTTAAEHRRKNMPVRLINKASGITDQEITNINARSASTDVLGITADPSQPLGNQIGQLEEIQYNPAMYDTSDILRDVEMVSGAQDASRGGVNKAKTATEAEIMSMGMQSRTGEQLDTIEDWLTAILQYCAQLLLQNMTPEQIKAAFGESAVWPQLSKKELFQQVNVLIRAGSTSKPNKMRERDQWLQFMPQMQEAVQRISELQANGQVQLADALVKMLDETLRRFDERMSIKEFLGGDEDDEEGGTGGPEQMLAMARKKIEELTAQAQEALDARTAELDKREEAVSSGETDLAIDRIQFAADQKVAAAEKGFDEALRRIQDERAAERLQQPAAVAAAPGAMQATPQMPAGEPVPEAPSVIEVSLDSLINGQVDLAHRMDRLLEVNAAPRRTTLIRDELGRPAESISVPDLEQSP